MVSAPSPPSTMSENSISLKREFLKLIHCPEKYPARKQTCMGREERPPRPSLMVMIRSAQDGDQPGCQLTGIGYYIEDFEVS